METTVTLQPPFEFYLWVWLFAISALLLSVAFLLIMRHFYKKAQSQVEATKEGPVFIQPSQRVITNAKGRYVGMIQAVLADYNAKKITKRDGYQKLSIIIRGFVQETTGINVENYTLYEIKGLGIEKLNKLIEEYYVPEFAEDNRAIRMSFEASCNSAMGVIKTWN